MYKRNQVEKYHNIHQGIHQRNKGKEIVSIQCQLDDKGYYHDTMLEDGTIMYIGEGGLSEPQEEIKVKTKSNGTIHRMYGNHALVNAQKTLQPFHVVNKHKDGTYEYLGKWIVTYYEYSPWQGKPAHFRFYLECVELPHEFVGEYGQKLIQIRNTKSEQALPPRTFYGGVRVVRDTRIVEELKQQYNYKCMICNTALTGISNPIVEVHHLIPLGRPHNGPDVKENMIVLCPNHHAQFDAGVLAIGPSFEIYDINGVVYEQRAQVLHYISKNSIQYHNVKIYKGARTL
ncbi:HNH endonuclease [Aneurinibacillus thermoaerophilus]|uniref:HNH endonuclease n=1 Tax=Aneurinibacillus thermoaerophilus TaxID=143495 RepID=UPI002E1DE87F|nr:HNH endonuclease [Aneurinibacillus thermoaerophilus]MED0766158.1 HNH endonuclease [Aneurinibacillus thermoaerophilus]